MLMNWQLLICCPISTSIRGQRTEIVVKNLEKPSVVASNLIQTLSLKDRRVKFNPYNRSRQSNREQS